MPIHKKENITHRGHTAGKTSRYLKKPQQKNKLELINPSNPTRTTKSVTNPNAQMPKRVTTYPKIIHT